MRQSSIQARKVTDQVNRKMKREADGLGRLVKVYE
jgi:hypothetical protein